MKFRPFFHLMLLTPLFGAGSAARAQEAGKPPATPLFQDVPPGHWAFAAVQSLGTAGIIEGYPAGEPATQATIDPTERIVPASMAGIAFQSSSGKPLKTIVKATPKNDAVVLTPLIKTALVANAALRGTQINVDTLFSPPVIILRGMVLTPSQKTLAEAIAHKNAPYYKIVNQLRIPPSK